MEQEVREKEGYTMALAIVDAVPVLLFGASCCLVGIVFHSVLFFIGACLSLAAGALKVLWKILLACIEKEVSWLNHQFRYLMPAGFLCMLLSIILGYKRIKLGQVTSSIINAPSIFFFLVGMLGVVAMAIFAKRFDESVRANWIEQIVNSIAQLGFFLGILFIML